MPKSNRTPTKRKYDRRIIALRGDTQAGHKGGLENPDTLLPAIVLNKDGGRRIKGWKHVSLEPMQERLWSWHEGWRKDIGKLAGSDPITLVEMGDMTQGVIFPDNVSELDLSEQYFIAKGTINPWLAMKQVKQTYIAKGTGVHTWNGSTETMLERELQHEHKKPVQLADHWLLNIGGYSMDIAHHGPGPGKRAWLHGNEFRWYLLNILMTEITLQKPIPQIVLRAHKHELTRATAEYQVGGNYWQLPGIVTPPLCFIDDHATKVMNSPTRMGLGIVALEVINGKLLDAHTFTRYIDLRILEVVE